MTKVPAVRQERSERDQGRLDGVRIRHAAFTNLSRDHLDYHQTMQAYEAAKLRLFTHVGLQGVVLNVDDPVGVKLARTVPVLNWKSACPKFVRVRKSACP